ncbi:hypothetical protein SAMN05660865_00648 [Caloramator fervidus]|uniref:Prolow-density lipoprotein receptor-related protein 1-like beta-propeller domain-containing protein n=1 Tax=Caloramator fervidus TaxID=29344 RepID=A0A1H5TKH4_9CLOT|nr:DUF5050 domain-containing protein [Caloramator fervidus]SEF63266.1 hypothetical protein SAMN05660865_00648 [Caloramator fervidus]
MKRKIFLLLIVLYVLFINKAFSNMDYGQTLIYPNYYFVDKDVYYVNTNNFNLYKNKNPIIYNINEAGFILFNNQIIFVSNKDNCLYSYNILTKKLKKISQNKVLTGYNTFFIFKDYIFYYDSNNKLRKIKNGREFKVLPYENSIALSLLENKRCFKNYILTWGQNGIKKINLDNYSIKQLYDGPVYSLDVYNDKIYFINSLSNISVIDLNGKKLTEISCKAQENVLDFYQGRLIVDYGYLYFIDYESKKLIRVNLKNYKKEILEKNVEDFYIKDKRLFYINSVEGDNIKYIDISKGIAKALPKDKYLYFLDLNNNYLCLLVKSKNPQNIYGEIKYIKVD